MEKHLWTGAMTLQCPEEKNRQFGIVGASSSLTSTGQVDIILNMNMVSIKEIEGGFQLSLPESWAFELARKVDIVALRLSHLRSLAKLELLKDTAFTNELHNGTDEDSVTSGKKP